MIGIFRSWLLFLVIYIIAQWYTFAVDRSNELANINENPLLIPLQNITTTQVTLESLQMTMDDLQSRHRQLQQTIWDLDYDLQTLSEDIDTILTDMVVTRSDLDETMIVLWGIESDIAKTQSKQQQLEQDFIQAKSSLQGYLDIYYRISNEIYTTDATLSTSKVLLKSDSIFDGVQEHDIVLLLQYKIQQLLQTLQQLQTETAKQLEQLNIFYVEQQHKEQALQSSLDQLLVQEQSLKKLFQQVQIKQAQAQEYVREVQSQQAKTDQKIQLLTQPKSAEISDIVAKIVTRDDLKDDGRYLSWPVLPHQTAGAYLSDLFDTNQWYLWFEVYTTTPVYNPWPAIVYRVVEDDIWSWMMLLHKHGYVSVVWPLSRILVQQDQYIERGQIVGYANQKKSPSGKKWHTLLQRSVWKDGTLTDPLLSVDLSIFRQKFILPDTFHVKYDEDVFARTIDRPAVFPITGGDMPMRVSKFLSTYGVAPFNDVSVRLAWNKGTGIDPYFGICVWRAETSYRNFKSENNIGNVGNNDRWDTVIYETPADGIRAVYNVLNNQYLGHYHTMDQLSRYGNDDGFIYASSPFNRQKNIMYCLSMLYDYHIPETFPFRIKK